MLSRTQALAKVLASARDSSRYVYRPKIKAGYQKQWVFVGDYARNIFRFDFWNEDVCFFVWIYEIEQFKLKEGRCFAFISNQWGDLICLLLGTAIFFIE